MSLIPRKDSIENDTTKTSSTLSDQNFPHDTNQGSLFQKLKIIAIACIALGGLSFGGYYFFQASHTASLENPTNETIEVQIDSSTPYNLEAGEYLEVKISSGEHTVKMNGKEIGKFTKKAAEMNPIINPTLSDFIIEETYYSDSDRDDLLKNNTVTFLGSELEGPFEIVNTLYIPKTWDYDLGEAFPEEVSLSKHQSYTLKKKIFSEYEFLQTYYPEELEENTDSNTETQTGEITGE